LGYGHPFNIFLFDPNDRFADILKTSDSFGISDTWQGDNTWYRPILNALPPLTLLIEISFGFIVKYTHINEFILLFLIYILIIFSIYKIIINKVDISEKKTLFLICILNYGFITFLDRGNSSILTFIFLLLFLIYIDKPKLSMLGLVISISLKITPIYFFIIILLFKKDKLKSYIFYFLLYLFLINISSYIFVSNFYEINLLETYNLNTFLSGGKSYLNDYLYEGGGIAYGSSLITFFSFLLLGIKKVLHLKDKIILPLSQLSFFLLLSSYFFIYLNKRFFLKENFHFILFVFVSFLLFSPVTGDYYLSYLVFPLLYYNEKINSKYLLPIALLLSPKNYIFYYIFSIQIIINPILMCIILYMIYFDIKSEKNTTTFLNKFN
jgi:hypothetical protein